MISIDFINGYWTLVVNGNPVLSCTSFQSAMLWLEDINYG